MGILGRLLAGLRGSTDDQPARGERQTAGERPVSNRPTTEHASRGGGGTVSELVAALDDGTTVEPAHVQRLVDRAETTPGEFDNHVPQLVAILRERDGLNALAAGAAVAALADSNRALVARHAEALVAALQEDSVDDEEGVASEFATDALSTLARSGQVPTDELVDVVTQGPPHAQRGAASVLAVVAATTPGTLPLDRLAGIYEGGDTVARAGAAYVLTVVSAEQSAGGAGPAPTADGLVDLAATLRRGDVDGFVTAALTREAIEIVVEETTGVALSSLEVASTPMGVQLVLRPAGEPDELLGEASLDELSDVLAERLGLDDPQIDVQEAK